MTVAAELDDLSLEAKGRVDREVERFERRIRDGRDPSLHHYWSVRAKQAELRGEEPLVCLSELIKAEMRRRFSEGDRAAVSEYLDAYPELAESDARVVSLVYEEFCLREEDGESPDVDSFCERYPRWRDLLKAQLAYHQALSEPAEEAVPDFVFPTVGDFFEEFRLKERIGNGKYSRVFLADDTSLGGKRVVLKVSLDRGREAEAQGALDHPNIVPVNSVVYDLDDDNDLRGISMPYRQGACLDDLVRRLRPRDGAKAPPTQARAIWEGLIRSQQKKGGREEPSAFPPEPTGNGWRGFPIDGGYPQGVAWIGMTLARALHYAHQRQTFHRDVKPGNVLLTLYHGPQLLDFNLAKAPHTPQQAKFAIQGGTVPYMAPEQIASFLNPNRWKDVNATSDIYSLGLVLRELLTFEPPDLPDPKLSTARSLQALLDRRSCLSVDIRSLNPQVPHALEAIVQKCLHYRPEDRYQSGEELAEDLDRFLRRLPLAKAENPSRAERTRNWAARNRKLLIANAVYLTVLTLVSPLVIRQAYLFLLPDAKDREEVARAVHLMRHDQAPAAIEILMQVMWEQPKAPLPRFLLGLAFAIADALPSDPAEMYYGGGLALPESQAKLEEWARKDPEIWKDLERFGWRRLDRSRDRFIWEVKPELDLDHRRELDLAGHAMSQVLAMNPNSTKALQSLAAIAEHRQHFEVALAFLTRLVETGVTEEEDRNSDISQVTLWRLQHSRVAAQLAVRLSKSEDQRARRRARELADLGVNSILSATRTVPPRHLPYYNLMLMQALIVRGRLHYQDGEDELGAAVARRAKTTLERWIALSKERGEFVTQEDQDRMRDRVRLLLAGEWKKLADSSP